MCAEPEHSTSGEAGHQAEVLAEKACYCVGRLIWILPPGEAAAAVAQQQGEDDEQHIVTSQPAEPPDSSLPVIEPTCLTDKAWCIDKVVRYAGCVIWILPPGEAAAAVAQQLGEDGQRHTVTAVPAEPPDSGLPAAQPPTAAPGSVPGQAAARQQQANGGLSAAEPAGDEPAAQGQTAAEHAAWPAGKAGTVGRQVERGVFSRILLTLDMINDHLPDAYLSAIQQLGSSQQ